MNRKLNKRSLFYMIGATSAVFLLQGCQAKSSGDTSSDNGTTSISGSTAGSGTQVAADAPSDSTGALASLSLNFTSFASGLALQATTPSLDIGSGIILTDARVNVGSIKIKANKEMSDDEKTLKAAMKEEKKARELAIESDKKALEDQKEAIKASYEVSFDQAANEAAKDTLKAQMEAEIAVVEQDMAILEATKDGELDELEAERDGNLRWKGPYVYDLVNDAVSPAIPEVELLDGSYRRIEFKVKPNRVLDGSDPLLNNSIYIAGTVAVAGVATPFTVSLRIDEEFKLMGAGSVALNAASPNVLAIGFDPVIWFTGIDLSLATADSLGTLVISDSSNPDIFQALVKNIKSSTRFGKDDDNDGKLEDSESEGDGAEGVAEAEESSESELTDSK